MSERRKRKGEKKEENERSFNNMSGQYGRQTHYIYNKRVLPLTGSPFGAVDQIEVGMT